MLKLELHCHAKEDAADHVPYSAKEFLDAAKKKGFDVVSFTFHKRVFFPKDVQAHAKRLGILLIPGCEMEVEGCHVLIHHPGAERLKGIVERIQSKNGLDAIRRLKGDALVTAPHPYYRNPIKPWEPYLGKRLEENVDAFDAVEFSHFYWKGLTMNTKAVLAARRWGKPIIGTGDVHRLSQFGFTYALVDAKKDAQSVLAAVRNGKVQLVTRTLPLGTFLKLGVMNALSRT